MSQISKTSDGLLSLCHTSPEDVDPRGHLNGQVKASSNPTRDTLLTLLATEAMMWCGFRLQWRGLPLLLVRPFVLLVLTPAAYADDPAGSHA